MNKTAIAFLVSSLLVGTAQAELVSNGDFETQNFTGWTQSGDSSTNFVTDFTTPAHGGSWSALLGPDGTNGLGNLSQTLATINHQAYTVQFDLVSLAGYPGNQSAFLASFGAKSLIGVTNQPAPVNVLDGDDLASTDWAHYSFVAVATSKNTDLTFSFSNQTAYFGLDNVSVVAVPEPDEYVLILLGAGLVTFQVRRKNAMAASRCRS